LESEIEIDSKYNVFIIGGLENSGLQEETDKKDSSCIINADDCLKRGMYCCPNDLCGRKLVKV
jgi:hypothetical protein